ncbi:hypothetical protein GCM10009549_24630 [Streptomyces thermoalcalitolerans]|uniref:Uncharacterized protein n=1 Tax=Streptomyces thermoalcalitolerans TaxID=65605 RepID=A0ABN1NMY5_9ACTN
MPLSGRPSVRPRITTVLPAGFPAAPCILCAEPRSSPASACGRSAEWGRTAEQGRSARSAQLVRSVRSVLWAAAAGGPGLRAAASPVRRKARPGRARWPARRVCRSYRVPSVPSIPSAPAIPSSPSSPFIHVVPPSAPSFASSPGSRAASSQEATGRSATAGPVRAGEPDRRVPR